MPGSSLRALLTDAKPHIHVRYVEGVGEGEQVLALVTTLYGDDFWIRLFTDNEWAGNRLRHTTSELVTLLAEAGIPVEHGWERWEPPPPKPSKS